MYEEKQPQAESTRDRPPGPIPAPADTDAAKKPEEVATGELKETLVCKSISKLISITKHHSKLF